MTTVVAHYPVDENVHKSMAQDSQLPNCNDARLKTCERIALVLDMDECLVHSKFMGDVDYRQYENRPKEEEVFGDYFEIFMDDGEKAVVNKRPGLDEFLVEASKHFDLYIFTAGLEIYGKPVIDYLELNGVVFKGRFYRDSCLFKGGVFLKDLQVVRSDLSRVILVDNNPISFLLQPGNGIPVPSFFNDPKDQTLLALTKLLHVLSRAEDVRPCLQKMFRLEELLEEHRNFIMAA